MSDIEWGLSAWIWPSRLEATPNRYVQFRHEFVLSDETPGASIRVSCDSNYALWVNGEFVDCGQFHDYPDRKTCDVIPLPTLRVGVNVLAFVLYYQGTGSSQYIVGAPGLLYAVEAGKAAVSSGAEAICRPDPCYVSGPMARISHQLGYTFAYDAAGDDGWRTPGYQPDGSWSAISQEDMTLVEVVSPRPLPKLVYGEPLKLSIVAQGVFAGQRRDEASVGEMMQTDCLSSRLLREVMDATTVKHSAVGDADGVYLVLDLAREEAGYLDLDVEAAAGTVIDIAWGEHLDDLRVRASVGGRSFACRYVCADGRRSFTHYFTRFAGRYLQLHISGLSGDVVLHRASLIPVEYPVEVRGSFASGDRLVSRIYETSVRTLHLCMHEHYEDCPWREQALYAMDMRNQALAGYYCFGEYEFPRVSLDLLAHGLKQDGFLELCAPAEIEITIPVFTLAWILAVADHYLYTGDQDAARGFYPTVSRILGKRAEEAGGGLLPCPTGPRYWHFYEWACNLDGCEWGDCTRFAVLSDTRYDAPLNLFYCLALQAAASIAEGVGDSGSKDEYLARADALRPLIHDRFWDAADRSYVTYLGSDAPLHRSELVQALAILAGVCDEPTAGALRERLASDGNGLVATTLSHSLYKFEALLTDPDAYGKHVLDAITADWGYMLDRGATSFWETIKGSADFDNAGSLCHGWSGIPAYFYHAYLLGVKPTSPGFRTFAHAPVTVSGLAVDGIVPTPHGPITIIRGKARRPGQIAPS